MGIFNASHMAYSSMSNLKYKKKRAKMLVNQLATEMSERVDSKVRLTVCKCFCECVGEWWMGSGCRVIAGLSVWVCICAGHNMYKIPAAWTWPKYSEMLRLPLNLSSYRPRLALGAHKVNIICNMQHTTTHDFK